MTNTLSQTQNQSTQQIHDKKKEADIESSKKVADGTASYGGSFDDSNDDIFVASLTPVKSAGKRSATNEEPCATKLAKLVENDREPEAEEINSGFLAEKLDPAEVELEVNSKDLFEGWNELEQELDEPKSGEELLAARIDYSDADLYANDSAQKGDMYQNMQVEGDEDTDDEELYYSKDNIGSIHEVEEDIEHEKALEQEAQLLKNTTSQISLPPGQSQLIQIQGGPRTQPVTGPETMKKTNSNAGNVNPTQQVLVEKLGPNVMPDAEPENVERGPADPNNANVGDVAPAAEPENHGGQPAEPNNVNVAEGAAEIEDGMEENLDDLSQNLYQLKGKSSTYAKHQENTRKM